MSAEIRFEKKNLIRLFLYYIVSQGLLLIVSGLWFDDWCIVNISKEGLRLWASEMGKPEVFPIVYIMNALPDIVYKSIIFFGYFVVAVCFFMITKKIFQLESNDALCLTFIYLSVPVNDIRIERLGLPYTLGLTLYFLGFFILVYKYEQLTIRYHIASLLLFFISYILNSLLFFMGIVWLYIIFKEKNIKNVIKRIDFFIAPFIYFIIDNLFFPAHGVYSGYNKVDLESMIRAFKGTFRAESGLAGEIISLFIRPVILHPVLVLVIIIIMMIIEYHIGKKNGLNDKNSVDLNPIFIEFITGIIALFMGLYPYVVVGNSITTTGFNSRNVILAPFGFALILHTLIKIGLKRQFRHLVVLSLMIVSAIHFNKAYISYQSTYYKDRGLQEYLKRNLSIGELKTIAVTEDDGGASWYMYNGMFEEVYDNENRLVNNLNSIKTVLNDSYQSCVEREWYNMTGYDVSYHKIDAVIIYSNSITLKEAFFARIHELMGGDISGKLLGGSSFRIIYPEDEEFSSYIIQ